MLCMVVYEVVRMLRERVWYACLLSFRLVNWALR